MRSRQSGVTFIGWVVLLIPVAVLFFAGLKLFPIYMNHFKVVQALNQTADANRSVDVVSPTAMRIELEKRFDIEGIEEPSVNAIGILRDDGEWVLVAQYDRETSLMGNLWLTVHFNKRVVVQ